MPQDMYGINHLKTILEKEKPNKIFLVTGKQSYASSGAQEKIDFFLSSYNYVHFSDFTPNPKIEDIEKGIELYKKEGCDLVIAIGGGSVIDIAKAINVLASQSDIPKKYILKESSIVNSGATFIAIPTTAGTGSEATHFAVVYVGKDKYSLAHKKYLLPDYTILDHSLTFNLPKKITAASGMDALAQAIEAYWSVNSTEESKEYSSKAIKLILENLSAAVNNPTELSREKMMLAANLAGKAINIAKTTACHAISYPLTSYYGITHGHAVALTLGEMFIFNSENLICNDPRGSVYVKKTMQELIELFSTQNAQEVKLKIDNLMDSIGLKISLGQLGIALDENFWSNMETGFNPERAKNNPINFSREDLTTILNQII